MSWWQYLRQGLVAALKPLPELADGLVSGLGLIGGQLLSELHLNGRPGVLSFWGMGIIVTSLFCCLIFRNPSVSVSQLSNL